MVRKCSTKLKQCLKIDLKRQIMMMIILEEDPDFLKEFKNTMNKAHQIIKDDLCKTRFKLFTNNGKTICRCKKCSNVKKQVVGFDIQMYPSCFNDFDNYFEYLATGEEDVIQSSKYDYNSL